MKCISLLIFLVFISIIAYNDCHFNKLKLKLKKANVASEALANLFIRLGVKENVAKLATRIEYRCPKGKLLNHCLNIIKRHHKMLKNSNKRPYTLTKHYQIYKKQRITLFKSFIKSFLKCGKIRGAKKAITKLFEAYFNAKYLHQQTLVNFMKMMRKIFYRKKVVRNQRDNRTIYKYSLLKKMIYLKKLIKKCNNNKNLCRTMGYKCKFSNKICKYTKKFKESIIYKVRRVFSYYFSINFAQVINFMNKQQFKNYVGKKKGIAMFYTKPY
jgi:hypothetical protein